MTYSATYSPEDNKIRLYASSRLDKETYDRVKAAGFKWAPKQDLFVAPMWTPGREDLAIELAGEIGDEDKSLMERQEERSERFENYSENRAADAETARAKVHAIADNIPFGQPILVGHHSEKHARRDAEKIENGMRRTVKMWEESKYWAERATAAIAHARYKELPAVRARRIKGLEADQRKWQRAKDEAENIIKAWGTGNLTRDWALTICNGIDRTSKEFKLADFPRNLPASQYEGMMSLWSALGGSDGEDHAIITAAQAKEISTRVNQRCVARHSRWLNHIQNRLTYERAMLAESGGTAADKTKPEKGGACKAWCSWRGGFSTIQKVNKVSVTLLDNWGNGGADFTRTIPFDKLKNLLSKAQVDAFREAGRLLGETPRGFHLAGEAPNNNRPTPAPKQPEADAKPFEQIKEQLKAGVKIVVANQLFPTPADLAKQMVYAAGMHKYPALRVLEPSAGTGAILEALKPYEGASEIVGCEINLNLVDALRNKFEASQSVRIIGCDFLQQNGNLGKFDRVIMNPPFENGDDIKHIKHAATFLKPGGKLVAICANGPRQNEQLKPLATTWEVLPPDTFKESGTGVNTVILTIQN